jgi:hypothetical protein
MIHYLNTFLGINDTVSFAESFSLKLFVGMDRSAPCLDTLNDSAMHRLAGNSRGPQFLSQVTCPDRKQ